MFLGGLRPLGSHESFGAGNFNDSSRIAPNHFEPMQLLGTGSFGEVYLVRKKSSGVYYAMKVQSKNKIISNNLVKYA
jgi:serine/threonine protein kinase